MIREIRLLPPLAIARLGSATTPMENYHVRIDPREPLGFRKLVPAPTLTVDRATGEITAGDTPAAPVKFKDGNRVKPIAPFLEVWCDTGDGVLRPLTTAILAADHLAPADVRWQVRVANVKARRRTRDTDDAIDAVTPLFSTHDVQPLTGRCNNFVAGKTISFGDVQYIKPTVDFPGIRLRFTPAPGFVFGSTKEPADRGVVRDIVYNDTPGSWSRHRDSGQLITFPGNIFAREGGVSRGYLDDTCDGIVDVELTVGTTTLRSFARISSGPPDYAPDSMPIRTVADELEQALGGPAVAPESASPSETEEILRRAFETVRLQNTAAMNGNLPRVFNMAGDRPIMAPALVDNLALRSLHQSVVASLQSDTAAWFGQVLRDHDEVGDETDRARRKMPAMMRGADGSYLALTRRQVDVVRKSATRNPAALAQPQPAGSPPVPVNATAVAAKPRVVEALEGTFAPAEIAVAAVTEQLAYRAAGNPPGTLATTAISNCFPGLEFDFRNAFRKMFLEIELHEWAPWVIAGNTVREDLIQLMVGGETIEMFGLDVGADGAPGSRSTVLELSNTLASLLALPAGTKVRGRFRRRANGSVSERELTVRGFFAPGTAAIAPQMADPGELTQSLCSPWQNDYKECGCYYWAASRPDYVNVEPGPEGTSVGHNWLQTRDANSPKEYARDPGDAARLVSYDTLFREWENALRFVVGGNDSE